MRMNIDIINNINLEEYYTYYNYIYFNNTLPPVEFISVVWNPRLRVTAGYCIKKIHKTIIQLNPLYLTLYPGELSNVLVHEMIHLITMSHGKEFKSEVDRIKKLGLEVTIYTKYDTRKSYKWKYICFHCAQEYNRYRRLNIDNYLCSKCSSELIEIQLR